MIEMQVKERGLGEQVPVGLVNFITRNGYKHWVFPMTLKSLHREKEDQNLQS